MVFGYLFGGGIVFLSLFEDFWWVFGLFESYYKFYFGIGWEYYFSFFVGYYLVKCECLGFEGKL